jgi:hypothetical protein
MKTAFLIPTGGVVRDPQNKAVLPATGAWMPLDTYWKRRLMFGEVRITDPPTVKEVKKFYERKDEE